MVEKEVERVGEGLGETEGIREAFACLGRSEKSWKR